MPTPTPQANVNTTQPPSDATKQDTQKLDADFKRLLEKEWQPANGVFQDPARFAHAQRVATMLCASALAPEVFRGTQNLGSAVIAVDMAFRLNMNPLMVMQQLYVVYGKPGWSAQFVIAVINASGKFTPIRFRFTGDGDTRQCVAYSKDLASGEILDGTPVSIALAKKEGWFQKPGSKWQSMAEQMLAYRAASFWGRIYAPEMFMGLPTADEIEDMVGTLPPPATPNSKPNLIDDTETRPTNTVAATQEETLPPPTETQPKPVASRLHKPQPSAQPAAQPELTEMQRQAALVREINELPPPDAVVVEFPAEAEAVGYRADLANIVEGIGVPQDKFLHWVHETGRYKGANKMKSIAELPEEACLSIYKDAAGLAKCARTYGKKEAQVQP